MIHIAGAFDGDIQRCTRCGVILTDYRHVMVPTGTPPLQGWAVDAHVEVIEGNPRGLWLTEDDADCRKVH
jgi:hypothetical protein